MQAILEALYADFNESGYFLVRMVLAGVCGVIIGIPALSVGKVQLLGKAFSESALLSLAKSVESEGK